MNLLSKAKLLKNKNEYMAISTVLKQLAVSTTGAALSFVAMQAKPAQAITVDFTNQGTFTTTEYSQNGLTVTGSDVLKLGYSGLGVGKDDSLVLFGNLIANGASALFSFSSAAEDVSLKSNNGFSWSTTRDGVPGFKIEGFGVGGTSLGVVSVPFDSFLSFDGVSISGLFHNSLLSAFEFSTVSTSSEANAANITSVSFTPTSVPKPNPTSVPEPHNLGEIVLAGGLVLLLKKKVSSKKQQLKVAPLQLKKSTLATL